MSLAPWYEQSPERLNWELQRFADFGITAETRMENGILEIHCEADLQGSVVPVRIIFPIDYPDKAPELYGPEGTLSRHQGLSGNFCVLEDPQNDWSPERSAAELVGVNLRRLLEDSSEGSAAIAAGEADFPEPATGFFPYGELTVLVPDPFLADTLPESKGEIALDEVSPRAMLLTNCVGLGIPDPELLRKMTSPSPRSHRGKWVSLDAAPAPPSTFEPLLQIAESKDPQVFAHLQRRLRKKRIQKASQWLGLTFLEEGPTRGQQRRSWIFLEVTQVRSGVRGVTQVARAQGLNLRERQRRIPELKGAENLRLLVIGAGSLGAPISIELAKAGVGVIDIVDHDKYDVNNAVRHILPVRIAGYEKAVAVAHECQGINPFNQVGAHVFMVGGSQETSDRLDSLIDNAHMVVDATASQTVARILQKRARLRKKPLVVAELTTGSYGGEIIVLRGEGACYQCFLFAQADGQVPSPEAGPRTNVVPVGCSHPAFSGAGFDAAELAAITARTILRASGAVGYPPLDYDWSIVNFRSQPRWQLGSLEIHTSCTRAH